MWRSWEVAILPVSPSIGAQRAREMIAALWLNAHHDSPVSQSVFKNIHIDILFLD